MEVPVHGWYLRKEWIDRTADIEAVYIHYLCTPSGAEPDWDRPHPRWPMTADAGPLCGLPGVGTGTTVTSTEGTLRQHVLKLPTQVRDDRRAEATVQYLLHYYYEVIERGHLHTTDVFCDEIVSRELEYIDWEGRLSGVAIYWSVADWSAPVWMPTEDPRFLAVFGGGHERCSSRLYCFPDKPRFSVEKWNLMRQLPLPWRWTARIYAPKGTIVRQRWHIGNLSPGMDWEDWDPHPPGDFVHFL